MASEHRMAITAEFERTLDDMLAGLTCFSGAEEKRLAPLLPRDFVLAGNYIKSFPQHAFSVDNSINSDEQYLLSPTCCYPVFYDLKDSQHGESFLITHKNLCFRCEEFYAEGRRQIAYTMREYILMSDTLDTVTAWIDAVKLQVVDALSDLGLKAELEVATDPFFNSNDYKQAFQRDQKLKHEFVIGGVACGSVNLHLKAFSRSCNITSHEGHDYYSACFGLGYDRVQHQYDLARAAADAKGALEHV
ncbi:hypothetical protein GCM10022290_11010 [Sagittula marina]